MAIGEWRICDATLREGMQSGLALFPTDRAKTRYAEIVLSSGLADAVEIFRPGTHLSVEAFEALTTRWGSRVRVYCGVAHRRPEIPGHVRSISVTLLGSRREAGIEMVRALADERPDVAVRVGLECVSRWGAAEIGQTVRELAAISAVDCVSLCDSLGELVPSELRAMAGPISAVSGVRLGGHFHDDVGLATANAAGLVAARWAVTRWTRLSAASVSESASHRSRPWSHCAREAPGVRERQDTFATLRMLAVVVSAPSTRHRPAGDVMSPTLIGPDGTLRAEYRDLYEPPDD